MTQREIVLIHSPLVGANSVLPTARALESRGEKVVAPSPYADGESPAWRDWPEALRARLPALERPVFVGHSMASLLAARLAADYPHSALCSLDGNIPPASGPTEPVAASFRPFLESLPEDAGILPPWHQWWPGGIFEDRQVDEALSAELVRDIPALRRDWFDDAFEMPSWDHADKGFVKLATWFDAECERARDAGWSTLALDGIHLYPAIEPEQTATAILGCIARMTGEPR
ncbi:MAG: alpha/beta fold hydrolase [Erythrobacter sp.]